jgi:hypothetical protein
MAANRAAPKNFRSAQDLNFSEESREISLAAPGFPG